MNQLTEAKRALENILNREWCLRGVAHDEFLKKLRDSKYYENALTQSLELFLASAYFLRKNTPEIVKKPTRQIVLSINDSYIGKARILGETSEHYVLSTMFGYDDILKSIKILRILGFNVPTHYFVGIENKAGRLKVSDMGFDFMLTHDLREGSKYVIKDIRELYFKRLKNGAELKLQLERASSILQDIWNEKYSHTLYTMSIRYHLAMDSLQEAFNRMFFIQIDRTKNTGRLVLGDLDHVVLDSKYRKE